MRALLLLFGWLAACKPTVTAMCGDGQPGRLLVLVHGYTSSGEELDALSQPLEDRGSCGRAYHLHRFDFGGVSRVAHDHNLAVETLGEALAEAIELLPQRCEVCAIRREQQVKVALVGRSLGGIVAREALMRGEPDLPPAWEVDRLVTLASPYFGSVRTRFATGLQSILMNGVLRTVLVGLIAPERGGTFGRVVDNQVRALRVGSPYLWDAHQGWLDWITRQEAVAKRVPDQLVVLGVGARDPVRQGDGVTRVSSGNVGPWIGAETLVVGLRHGELFNEEPNKRRASELTVTLEVLRDFIERGEVLQRGFLTKGELGGPVWMSRDPALARQLAALRAAELGDLGIRFVSEQAPNALLELPVGTSAFQAPPEWNREWWGIETEGSNPPLLRVVPLPSGQLWLPDLWAGQGWDLRVELENAPTVRFGLRVDGAYMGEFLGPDLPIKLEPNRPNLVEVQVRGVKAPKIRRVDLIPRRGRESE
jgi:pimeloyl-ACP methyl ester carboxylesterase